MSWLGGDLIGRRFRTIVAARSLRRLKVVCIKAGGCWLQALPRTSFAAALRNGTGLGKAVVGR